MRNKFFYWFTLILGAAILIIQGKRYYDSNLEFVFGELVVFIIGLVLVLKPQFLVDSISNYISQKFSISKPTNVQLNVNEEEEDNELIGNRPNDR